MLHIYIASQSSLMSYKPNIFFCGHPVRVSCNAPIC